MEQSEFNSMQQEIRSLESHNKLLVEENNTLKKTLYSKEELIKATEIAKISNVAVTGIIDALKTVKQ